MASSHDHAEAHRNGEQQGPGSYGPEGPIDFVDQVDYQLSFRTASGFLDTSVAHIAMVLE